MTDDREQTTDDRVQETAARQGVLRTRLRQEATAWQGAWSIEQSISIIPILKGAFAEYK